MSISAGTSVQTISTTKMIYAKPKDYGACYYEISAKELTEDERNTILVDGKDAIEIQVKISKKTALNVFLYSGISRLDAKIPAKQHNEQLTLNQSYSMNY